MGGGGGGGRPSAPVGVPIAALEAVLPPPRINAQVQLAETTAAAGAAVTRFALDMETPLTELARVVEERHASGAPAAAAIPVIPEAAVGGRRATRGGRRRRLAAAASWVAKGVAARQKGPRPATTATAAHAVDGRGAGRRVLGRHGRQGWRQQSTPHGTGLVLVWLLLLLVLLVLLMVVVSVTPVVAAASPTATAAPAAAARR